jgi:hypothetical protein
MKQIFAYLLFIVVFSALVFGQNRQNPGPPAQRVEQFKKLRLIEALKLDEETSVRFFAKYAKHEEAMRKINVDREAFVNSLEDMRRPGASDAEIDKVVKELIGMDAKVTEERTRFYEDIKGVLSMRQVADLLVFERNFSRNLRQLMQEMTRERRQGQGMPQR